MTKEEDHKRQKNEIRGQGGRGRRDFQATRRKTDYQQREKGLKIKKWVLKTDVENNLQPHVGNTARNGCAWGKGVPWCPSEGEMGQSPRNTLWLEH